MQWLARKQISLNYKKIIKLSHNYIITEQTIWFGISFEIADLEDLTKLYPRKW